VDTRCTGLEAVRSLRIRHSPSPDGDRDQPPGLVKHMANLEARYLGEIFSRPFPEPLHGGKTRR